MSSTSTNKQPLLVDRPLFDSVRVTTQTVGSASTNTVFVQGGQALPFGGYGCALSEDNNNGGVVDPLQLPERFFREEDFKWYIWLCILW